MDGSYIIDYLITFQSSVDSYYNELCANKVLVKHWNISVTMYGHIETILHIYTTLALLFMFNNTNNLK